MSPADRGAHAMTEKMPETLEICARLREGNPCLGVIWRPTPETLYCGKCGNTTLPGVVYRREDSGHAGN